MSTQQTPPKTSRHQTFVATVRYIFPETDARAIAVREKNTGKEHEVFWSIIKGKKYSSKEVNGDGLAKIYTERKELLSKLNLDDEITVTIYPGQKMYLEAIVLPSKTVSQQTDTATVVADTASTDESLVSVSEPEEQPSLINEDIPENSTTTPQSEPIAPQVQETKTVEKEPAYVPKRTFQEEQRDRDNYWAKKFELDVLEHDENRESKAIAHANNIVNTTLQNMPEEAKVGIHSEDVLEMVRSIAAELSHYMKNGCDSDTAKKRSQEFSKRNKEKRVNVQAKQKVGGTPSSMGPNV